MRLGIVNRIVPQDELMEMCVNLAQRMGSTSEALLRNTKEFLYRARSLSLSEGLDMEGLCYECIRQAGEYDRGDAAFAEGRRGQSSLCDYAASLE